MDSNQVDYTIGFYHAENSRVSNAILKALKKNDLIKIRSIKTPLRLRGNDPEHIYRHYIDFKDKMTTNKITTLTNEIIAQIPELFPINYLFKVKMPNNGVIPLGYKFEFELWAIDYFDYKIEFYTKIKEIKPNSEPITNYSILI